MKRSLHRIVAHRIVAHQRAGFSLVELALVVVILAVVLGSLAFVARSSDRMYNTGSVNSHLESQAAITMQHVCEELRTAGVDTLDPEPAAGIGAHFVQYLQARNATATDVTWSAPRRLELEYEAGELDDGLDNNGNGLIDECRLSLIENPGAPGEQRRVLTRWVAERLQGELLNGLDDNGNGLVDERGFTLERVGRAVIVRLTLQRRTVDGGLAQRTSQSSVRPRNTLGGS